MGVAGCALGQVNVCRSGIRSSSWWSAPRRVICFCEAGDRAREGTPTSRGKERSAAAPQLGRNQRNEANFVDVFPGYDCGGVGGCIASPAGASQGRTRQGLALRTMEGTTGQHSERVIEPLWFYRSHAEHTGLANEPKPLSHLIVVRNKIYGQPGGCNVVGFETRGACANLSGVMMGRRVPAPR